MAYLDVRDTNRKGIFQKIKKLISIFDENAYDPNETNILPEIKNQRSRLVNMFTEYFDAQYRNCNEILWEEKSTRFNLGQKCQNKNFVQNKIIQLLLKNLYTPY